jgi:16S rRNA (guanine527-N7)-methyltransferase
MLSLSEIGDLLGPYVNGVSPQLAEKIRIYVELLVKWNRKIALTTVTDPIEIVKFHFGESIFAISTGVCGKSRLADVGTGPGFPGLALAIADSSLQVTLIESNLKKCAFLGEVIRELSIANASVNSKRMESIGPSIGDYTWIAARALGQFDDLLSWSRARLEPNGHVLLWLGDSDVRKISVTGGWNWSAPALIPGSMQRFILRGAPKLSLENVPRGTK